MRWISVIAALAMAGPAVAVEDVDGTLAKLSDSQRSELLTIMDRAIADGPSSRFREVKSPRARTYCGTINTKNRMGAYVGFKRFFVIADQQKVHIAGEDMPPGEAPLYSALMDTNCYG